MRLAPVIRWSARTAAGLLLAALVVAGPASAGGGNGNSYLIPPEDEPYVFTYGEWSASFNQWFFTLPVDQNPLLLDTTEPGGPDGSEGQTGHVWFIGGAFQSTDVGGGNFVASANRTITIPAGTSLFFPIVNAEADTFVDVDPDDPDLEAKLRAKADALADAINKGKLYLIVDGKKVNQLGKLRADTLTTIGPLPVNNFFGAEPGSMGGLAGDGYYAMLKPLSVGTHTIEFGGYVDARKLFGITFKLDVKYTVIVTR